MIDRASIFASPEVVDWIKKNTVAVAIDQAYQRRQRDTEGEFYRKIIKDSPRSDPRKTTQGFYMAAADGTFLGYDNHRMPERVMKMLHAAMKKHVPAKLKKESKVTFDARYKVSPPRGGLVLRVRSKVLSGYAPTNDKWKKMVRQAVSRDNLWVSKAEHQALARGEMLDSLKKRIARFHLVDATRGEPPMWKESEIGNLHMELKGGTLKGKASLATSDGTRSYNCQLAGEIKVEKGRVTEMKLVALGKFEGEGRYTRGAPKGKFPLVVTFELADGSDVADKIPPQGSRGWVKGYIK